MSEQNTEAEPMDVESTENENPTTVAKLDVVESVENQNPITMAEHDVVESAENENPTTVTEPDVAESAENENPTTMVEPDVVESAENDNPITMAEPDVVESENEKTTTIVEPDVVESAENEDLTTMAEPDVVESAENENPTTTMEPNVVESTIKVEPLGSDEISTDSVSEDEQNPEIPGNSDKKLDYEEYPDQEPSLKKQKSLSDNVDPSSELQQANKIPAFGSNNGGKKSSKKKTKGNNVWTKSTSRKGKKKAKSNTNTASKAEDTVFIAPVPRFPDKNDDSPDAKICLSKVYKAEKVELSDDRLSAGSCKGYRMVRATRGVTEGAWYFEIKVVHMGESGHTRLGWSTEKGDLQAPVGYDANSFGYRDMDGSKIHKALRKKYGDEGYKEGDVIGFYINLPNGSSYAPKPPHLVWYKGQKYVCAPDPKEDPPKIIPGSEISFFKNGICQGVAFKDLYGGCYYPAASLYTLPYQPNCVVKFNFGPDFECFPADLGERPIPRLMIEVPCHGLDNRVENGVK